MGTLANLWGHRTIIGSTILAVLAAWTIPATLLARVIPRPLPSAQWWKRALYDLFVDTPAWAAAVGHSGIWGAIFNLPGVPSRDAQQNPTLHESRMMRVRNAMPGSSPPGVTRAAVEWLGGGSAGPLRLEFRTVRIRALNLALALGTALVGIMFTVPGCATCEIGQLSSAEQLAVSTVQEIAGNPSSTEVDLENAALGLLPGQIDCAVQALLSLWQSRTKGEPTPGRAHAMAVLQAYQGKHGKSACAPPPRVG